MYVSVHVLEKAQGVGIRNHLKSLLHPIHYSQGSLEWVVVLACFRDLVPPTSSAVIKSIITPPPAFTGSQRI